MSDFVKKTLKEAIRSRQRGGMQTGKPKVQITEAATHRIINEVVVLELEMEEMSQDLEQANGLVIQHRKRIDDLLFENSSLHRQVNKQQRQIEEMSSLCLTNEEVDEIKVEVIDSLILYLGEQPACNYEGNPTIEQIEEYTEQIRNRHN